MVAEVHFVGHYVFLKWSAVIEILFLERLF